MILISNAPEASLQELCFIMPRFLPRKNEPIFLAVYLPCQKRPTTDVEWFTFSVLISKKFWKAEDVPHTQGDRRQGE